MTVAHEYTLPRKMRVSMEDVPLPGMPEPVQTPTIQCTAEHGGYWRCVMIAHPETPDQHYYVAKS